jgi:hypothetical protein
MQDARRGAAARQVDNADRTRQVQIGARDLCLWFFLKRRLNSQRLFIWKSRRMKAVLVLALSLVRPTRSIDCFYVYASLPHSIV